MAVVRVLSAALLAAALLTACSSEDEPNASPAATASTPAATESAAPSPTPTPKPRPISVLGLAEQTHVGDRLRLGAVRERTAIYTSYDVTYRSRSTPAPGTASRTESLTISGVLNVPTGKGPFPAVVLAHGYIDPAIYKRGQGMTRERGYLAERGYVALHVDYRGHAESTDDPQYAVRMRLGYSADVINAVKALKATQAVPVDDDHVFLFGRSMGGGVGLKALVAEPGLVRGAAFWASVSSLEAQNFNRFIRPDARDSALRDRLLARHGLPEQNPRVWRENSSRPYFDRITEPVLLVHGRNDDTCPPPWARATHRALQQAGVESQLAWYDDGHAFGPAFLAAMDRTVKFFAASA